MKREYECKVCGIVTLHLNASNKSVKCRKCGKDMQVILQGNIRSQNQFRENLEEHRERISFDAQFLDEIELAIKGCKPGEAHEKLNQIDKKLQEERLNVDRKLMILRGVNAARMRMN